LRKDKVHVELQETETDRRLNPASYELHLDDLRKRVRVATEIHRAELDLLEYERNEIRAKAAADTARLESNISKLSAENRALRDRADALELSKMTLTNEVQTLKRALDSSQAHLKRKDAYGRDKARRLDNAMKVLDSERSINRHLQASISMKLGRLITTSLRNPWTAFALLWRIPQVISTENSKRARK
jgi:chromosome segregation ATPase